MLNVFVYGTLKPGGFYYNSLCAHLQPEAIPAWTTGRLYHLPDFGYPGVTKGEDRISGYVLRFADDAVLPALDELEAYDPNLPDEQNMYLRVKRPIETDEGPIEAWIYLMTDAKVAEYRGVHVPSGDWPHLET